MKRILISLIALLYSANAYADNVSNLMGLGMPGALAAQIDAQYGTAVSASIIPGADNTYDLGSASFSWRDLFVDRNALIGGTLGVTGVQTNADNFIFSTTAKGILSNTADAADTKQVVLTGGGAYAVDGSRGAGLSLQGNEAGGTYGTFVAHSGTTTNSALILRGNALGGAAGIRLQGNTGQDLWTVNAGGGGVLTSDATNGGGIVLARTGTTIAVDSGTAATTCSGTLTANGATPVVTNTTCALTASRIFLSKQSASTAVNGSCTVTAISNGVSFTVACLATDTGTYNFWITQEG